VSCTRGEWTTAVNTALCVGDASVSTRGDASPDAGACAQLDPTSFDQSCKSDSDCVAIDVGTVCVNGPSCLCPAAAINVVDQSSYEAELKAIESNVKPGPGWCGCPFFGTPRCATGRCVLCGGASGSAGCADGG
jgi:hypothetical protein